MPFDSTHIADSTAKPARDEKRLMRLVKLIALGVLIVSVPTLVAVLLQLLLPGP